MTFLQLQDRVMSRLNLTQTAARERVKDSLNDRMRRLQTSCNLGLVRRGTAVIETVAATSAYGPPIEDKDDDTIIMIKPLTVTIEDTLAPLAEMTHDQIRNFRSASGKPQYFYLTKFSSGGFTIGFYPTPDDVYEITIDGLLQGVDLADDGDEPAFPEDFHDALVFGAMADEYDHYDKADLSGVQEQKYEKRISDLRYFIHKSTYLQRKQNGKDTPVLFWWRV